MILLDTNVISEPTKLVPSAKVMEWLDRQDSDLLFVSSVSVAEVWDGVERLPDGRRKEALSLAMTGVLARLSRNGILSFDEEAALAYPKIMAKAKAEHYTITLADAFIAAIALSHGFSIATRDVEPFLKVGLTVINPWDESAKNV